MKILFMGTPDFSVPTLKTLIDSEHDIIGVVSQPDRPKGRGKQLQPTPVKTLALAHDLTIWQPEKVREEAFLEVMEGLDIDVAVVIAFGQILPKRFLDIPKHGCINIHASLLPMYRGAGPIQRAVMNGDRVTGVTTMMMDVGMDTGDMLLKEEVAIAEDETGGSLFDKLSVVGGPLLLETLKALEKGTLVRTPQEDGAATYAPMLDKKMGNIDWKAPAEVIERLIRGLNPWPSAYTYLEGKMLKIWDADVVDLLEGEETPGAITEIYPDSFVVRCGERGLRIKHLQLQGKRQMATGDFLRGYTVAPGVMLGQNPKEQ